MITKELALRCHMFYHRTLRNRDGTAVRARANGRCKTWKTRPDDWQLPVKHGLKDCFYLTPRNAADWLTVDPTEVSRFAMAKLAGLVADAPDYMIHDRLVTAGWESVVVMALLQTPAGV